MRGYTHILGGIAAGLALATAVGHTPTLVLAAGFGGLVPDWDHPHSLIGRWIPWPAVSHSRGPQIPPEVGRWGWPHPIWHRHQAHSIIGAALASGIVWGILAGLLTIIHGPHMSDWVGIGVFLGALSHLFLDAFNNTPQWWLWPMSRRGFRWPVHGPVARTDAIASLCLLGVIGTLVWHSLSTLGKLHV